MAAKPKITALAVRNLKRGSRLDRSLLQPFPPGLIEIPIDLVEALRLVGVWKSLSEWSQNRVRKLDPRIVAAVDRSDPDERHSSAPNPAHP